MPKRDEGVKLTLKLPTHVLAVLEGWTESELASTPQDVAEALLEELCVNAELRTFAASLVADR